MDGRYLIYHGFGNDAAEIFKHTIIKYNFRITYLSDSGINLENSRINLNISYESGLQVWYTNKTSKDSEMLYKICKRKGEIVISEFFKILDCIFTDNRKDCLTNLSNFLVTNLSDELSDNFNPIP